MSYYQLTKRSRGRLASLAASERGRYTFIDNTYAKNCDNIDNPNKFLFIGTLVLWKKY